MSLQSYAHGIATLHSCRRQGFWVGMDLDWTEPLQLHYIICTVALWDCFLFGTTTIMV